MIWYLVWDLYLLFACAVSGFLGLLLFNSDKPFLPKRKNQERGKTMNKFYFNFRTKEKTLSHDKAMKWFRDGNNVGIYVGTELRLTWTH